MPPADKRQRQKENARAARAAREAEIKKHKRNRTIRNAGIAAGVFVIAFLILHFATGGSSKKSTTDTTTTSVPTSTTVKPVAYPAGCAKTVPKASTKPTFKTAPPMTIDVTKTYVAHFTTTCGAFDITLAPKVAPKTVNSFVFLAKQGFYDGLKFQRVAKDFVVQGGDPKGNGSGGPGYNLPTEPPKDGYKTGSVAMANAGPNTTGSQFFLVLSANGAKGLGGPPYLYSDLGDITKGFDVVTKLGSLYNPDQNPSDPSTQKTSVPLYMFKVTITEK